MIKKIALPIGSALMCIFMSACAVFTAEAGSVAIIGGADGPTAIYTTNQLAPNIMRILIPAGVILIAVIVGIIAYIRHRRRK